MNQEQTKKLLSIMRNRAPQTYYAAAELIRKDLLEDEELLALFKSCIRDGEMERVYNDACFDLEMEKELAVLESK